LGLRVALRVAGCSFMSSAPALTPCAPRRVASLAREGRSSWTRRRVSATKCSEHTYARYSPSFSYLVWVGVGVRVKGLR
jgi:hypothetical protein